MGKDYAKKTSAGKPSVMRLNFKEGKPGYENIGKLKGTYTPEAVNEILNDLVSKFLAENRA